jgi:hypothetical protein
MGQPVRLKACHRRICRGLRRELKHLSTCRKRKKFSIPLVVAIEEGIAQTAELPGSAGL